MISFKGRERTSRRRERLHGQAGIYLPLLSIVAAALVTGFLAIGYVAVVRQRMSIALQGFTDDLCYHVSSSNLSTRHAEIIELFRDLISKRVNDKNAGVAFKTLQRAEIVEARLVAPVVAPVGALTTSDGASGPDYPFSSLWGVTPCTLDRGGDCLFRGTKGDVQLLDDADGVYPPGFWEGVEHGDSISCEVVAKLNLSVLGEYTVRAIATEHFDVRNGDLGDANSGLTIVVDPVFSITSTDLNATSGSQARFAWNQVGGHPPAGGGSGTQQFLETVSPLLNAMGHAYDERELVLFQGASEKPVGFRPQLTIDGITHQMANLSSMPKGLNSDGTADDEPPSYQEDASTTEELMFNCMNPLVLVRNIFVASVLELAARFGSLTFRTELLVLNPTHQDGRTSPNPSTLVVERGTDQDLLGRIYGLPMVQFRTADPTSPWLNPFETSPLNNDTDPATEPPMAHQAQILMANVLRHCLHLWDGNTEEQGGIERTEIPGITEGNKTYESFVLNTVYRFYPVNQDVVPPGVDPSGPNPYGWGHPNIYNLGTQGGHMRAADVAMTLGTVPSCPAEGFGCTKVIPNPANSTFRGDLLGAIEYLKGTGVAYLAPAGYPPYSTSGTSDYPYGDPEPARIKQCGAGSKNAQMRYAACANHNTHILFVLHRAPLDSADAGRIKAGIRALRDQGRLISVVFIPDRGAEVTVDKLNLLYEAFDFPDPNAGEHDPQDFLMAPAIQVFSPYNLEDWSDPQWGGIRFGAGSGVAEHNQFRSYWYYMVDREHNAYRNIWEEAISFFRRRAVVGRTRS